MPVRERGASFQADCVVAGKRIRRDFATRQEAEQFLAEVNSQKAKAARPGAPPAAVAAVAGLPLPPRPMTLLAAWEATRRARWLRSRDPNRTYIAKRMLAFFGEATPCHHITSARVRDFKAWLEEAHGIGGPTWNRYASVLRPVLELALEDGAMFDLPRVPRERETGGRLRVLEADEERALLGAALALYGQVAHDILVILVDTGLRPSELWALEGNRVRLQRNELDLVKTKTDQPRRVPMTHRARAAIERRLAIHGLGPLFPEMGPSPSQKLCRWFLCIREKAGLGHDTELTAYALRHTCGTRLARAGGFKVQAWLGHANVATTQKYVHLASQVLHDEDTLGALNKHAEGV